MAGHEPLDARNFPPVVLTAEVEAQAQPVDETEALMAASRRRSRILLYLGALCLAVIVAIGIERLVYWTHTSPYFSLTELTLEGDQQKVPIIRVKDAIEGVATGNYFSVDLNKIRDAVLLVPWVKDVRVRRFWPNRLDVQVDVYKAVALYEDGRLVSDEGEIFSANPEEAAEGDDLPQFSGAAQMMPTIVKHYRAFEEAVRQIPAKITEVDYSDRGSWTVVFQSPTIPPTKVDLGIDIVNDSIDTRFLRVAQSYQSIFDMMSGPPSSIDARYHNGFAAGVVDRKAYKAYLDEQEKKKQSKVTNDDEPTADDAMEVTPADDAH